MTISLRFAVLNLFLSQSHESTFVQAFIPYPSLSSRTFHHLSTLNARPTNRNIPASDPYASLVNKVTPSEIPQVPDVTADPTTSTDSSSIQSLANQVTDLVDQVNQAASTAKEASEQIGSSSSTLTTDVITTAATAAADATTASTSESTVTATKVAIAASTSSTSSIDQTTQKVPSLLDYLKTGTAKEDLVNLRTVTKQSVSSINESVIAPAVSSKAPETASISDVTASWVNSVKAGAAGAAGVAGSLKSSVASPNDTISPAISVSDTPLKDIFDNLQLEAYGAWYLAGATFIYAITAKDAGLKEATERFETELNEAKQKAEEAAEAASVAAEGAQKAKQLVDNIDDAIEKKESKSIGQKMLESSRMEQLQVENELMSVKIQNLQTKNAEQNILIARLVLKSSETATVNGASVKVMDIPLVKEIMERDPEEDIRILQILKEIDDENSKITAATKKKKKKVNAKKKKKVTKAKVTAKAKKAKSPAKKKKKKATKKKLNEKLEEEPVFMEKGEETAPTSNDEKVNGVMEGITDEDVDEIMAFVSASDAANTLEFKVKKEIFDALSAENVFRQNSLEKKKTKVNAIENKLKAEILDAVKAEKNSRQNTLKRKKTKAKKKKTKTMKAKVETPPEIPVEVLNPWGELKQSTLQRKTIAQLTAYLEEREVKVSGLSKKELVGAIQSL